MSLATVFLFEPEIDRSGKVSEIKRRVSLAAASFVKEYVSSSEGVPPSSVKFSFNAHGKPFVDGSRTHFSISHCGGVVAAVFCDEEIGADIEIVRAFSKSVCERRFTPSEREYILGSGENCADEVNLRFFEVWTGKEAFLKYCGTGISGGLGFETAERGGLSSKISSQRLGRSARIFRRSLRILTGAGDNARESTLQLAVCGENLDGLNIVSALRVVSALRESGG